jgi:charged multivesicular body protein 4
MALQALRKKKGYEKQLEQLDGVLNTIASQKGPLENASMNTNVLQVLKAASGSMKTAHNEMDADKVSIKLSIVFNVNENLGS